MVWILFNVIIFYMLYAVVQNKIDWLLWAGYAIVAAEGIILFLFNYMCPLTILARRYSTCTSDNFDIYLPGWLARYTKVIYTGILAIVGLITIYRLLNNKLFSGQTPLLQ